MRKKNGGGGGWGERKESEYGIFPEWTDGREKNSFSSSIKSKIISEKDKAIRKRVGKD